MWDIKKLYQTSWDTHDFHVWEGEETCEKMWKLNEIILGMHMS